MPPLTSIVQKRRRMLFRHLMMPEECSTSGWYFGFITVLVCSCVTAVKDVCT